MNRRKIDWENYEENFRKEWAKRDLEKSKSGSISFLESKGNYASRKEIFHAHWEDYLSSSDYWKNWRERINSFQNEKEVAFYTDKLQAFIDFVEQYTCKDENNYCGIDFGDGLRQWDPETTPKLIEQELKRLENISEEEFNKTDKWRSSVDFKELSVEEMKNDPWFSKQLGFGSENQEEKPVKKDDSSNIDYKTWTKNQLISEINRLKAENKELKNNQNLTNSERQERLQQNQQKLEKLISYYSAGSQASLQPNNSNDKFSTGWIVGGAVLLAIGGLLTILIYKNKKRKK